MSIPEPAARQTPTRGAWRLPEPARAFLAFGLLAGGGHLVLPLEPVPVTLQTTGVLLAGLSLAPRWAAGVPLAVLGLAMLGLPVLASGATGISVAVGPTAGFLWAFVLAAFGLALARRGGAPTSFLGDLARGLAAHAVILVLGFAWIAARRAGPGLLDLLGSEACLRLLPGAGVKSLLVALLCRGLRAPRPPASG